MFIKKYYIKYIENCIKIMLHEIINMIEMLIVLHIKQEELGCFLMKKEGILVKLSYSHNLY